MTTVTWNEASLTHAIDQFVKQVCFYPLSQQEFLLSLNALYHAFKPIYQPHLVYAKTIECFIQCMQWIECFVGASKPLSLEQLDEQQISILQMCLLQYQPCHFHEQYYQAQLEVANRASLSQYLQQLLNHYSQLLFVRVDLSYAMEYRHLINIEQVKSVLSVLLNRIANKDTCFYGLQGYAWALEQGADKGYHCHLLLIYDPSKRQSDWYLADQVGQLWKEITRQQGIFYNCNTSEIKAHYEKLGRLGVGLIHRNNLDEVSNALNAAMYLVNPEKSEQWLLAKVPFMRTFGIGQFDVAWRRGVANTMQQLQC
ncbi:YagK/YfjJ domain-containing protein [Acinetobacter sp. LF10]|uniref:YagK/YfjJ domain-containing protein n=1 Tax=Acinetobacter TaxID=469 RepID=UPI001298795B|nr:inovirus-type Gp2 protein [Acinetobacter junii]MQZ58016.1 inovirus Gp2 family protein [Acinetobacter junii]